MSGKPRSGSVPVNRTVWNNGKISTGEDQVATETAVALMYNCISHVVMMATPLDLEDFAIGFSLSEGIVDSVEDVLDIEIVDDPRGTVVSVMIPEQPFAALKDQRRNLTGRTGCGLCGAETLEQAIRPPRVVEGELQISHAAIQSAITAFNAGQQLMNQTGAVHGAAWCDEQGSIMLIREDVGRHNALDKLLGAMSREGLDDDGFVLVTSRASYEMVTKVAMANIKLMVAVSAPTSLAIDMARASGVSLVGFGRDQRHSVYFGADRLTA